ncbi:MAG: hypothetical protein JWO90_1813, partial [Solirubrobacterales bacterium]|nr:hypothetical protein [Solirubrobacterales bacterium]
MPVHDPSPSRGIRSFWALSGHSAEKLVTTTDRLRATATSAAMIVSMLVATAGGTAYMVANHNAELRPALLVGASWGVAVLVLEMLFVSAPARARFLGRLGHAVPRLAVSAVAAWLISGALLSLAYRTDIEAKLAETNGVSVVQVTEQATTTSEPALRKKALEAERDALDAALRSAREDERTAYGAFNAEATGTGGTGVAGCARECEVMRAAWEAQVAAVDELTAQQAQRRAEITEGIAAAEADIQNLIIAGTPPAPEKAGPEARSEALAQLRDERPALNREFWMWTVLLILLECAAVVSKTLLPQSDHDKRTLAQSRHATETAIVELEEEAQTAQETARVRGQVDRERLEADADVERAAFRADAAAHVAARQVLPHVSRLRTAAPAGEGDAGAPAPSRPRRRRRTGAWIGVAALTAVALLLTGVDLRPAPGPSSTVAAEETVTVAAGETRPLNGGLTLTVPEGAVAEDTPVEATYTSSEPWTDRNGVSPEVHLETAGELTGEPVLSWTVPADKIAAAEAGLVQLAFREDGDSSWTPYPATFDATTGILSASLEHFSSWKFWEWDWASIGAAVSQNVLQVAGARTGGPDCSQRGPQPEWVGMVVGAEDGDGLVVRACVGSENDDTLVIELTNNRPYGLWLDYGGAPIQFGWHESGKNASDLVRNLLGDYGLLGRDGLYLPPLSKASVGIRQLDSNATVVMKVWPTTVTLFADAWAAAAGDIFNSLGQGAAAHFTRDVFTKQLVADCFQAAVGAVDGGWLDPEMISKPNKLVELIGSVAPCVENALVSHGRSLVAQGALTDDRLESLSSRISALSNLGTIDRWRNGFKIYEQLVDFLVDRYLIGVSQDLGFGFRVSARST